MISKLYYIGKLIIVALGLFAMLNDNAMSLAWVAFVLAMLSHVERW